ncbi:hypothetical protein B0T22DRAFT_375669 [Podospora appendiculata]|uniref:Peptidase A1 domain-containing protein n=1 Tax=Podospora appendiculata TaxID=314037 RepID=A0AAE0XBE0_9PEZI|nr:hypothetical protein B0T22DRAFT_375669 [Podospora appendiculata]
MVLHGRPTIISALLLGNALVAQISDVCANPSTIELKLGNCTILGPAQADVNSWGIRVGVLNSSGLCIVPSTVVNTTFLTSSEICGDGQLVDANDITMTVAQCRSRRGGYITRSSVPNVPTNTLDQQNQGWVGFKNVIQFAANATLQLLTETVTMVEGLITDGQQSTTSHLGLASSSTLLQTLKGTGQIGALSWGLNSGSQSVEFPRDGSLVLGGYDSASLAGSFYEYDIALNKLNNRICPLQILITGLTLNINGEVVETIVDNSDKLAACIEPYDNLFRLPKSDLERFKDFYTKYTNSTAATLNPSDYKGTLLNLEPGIVYPKSSGAFNASLRFTINNELTVDIPHYEFERPLRGLDENGTVVLVERYTELQIYGSPAPEDAPVLGKAFLSQLYLLVDYDKMKFSLAPQNLEAGTPLPKSSGDCPSSGTDTNASSDLNLRTGLIVVGAVLGALLLLLAVLFVVHKARGLPQWLVVAGSWRRNQKQVKVPVTDEDAGQLPKPNGASQPGNPVSPGAVASGGGTQPHDPVLHSLSQPATPRNPAPMGLPVSMVGRRTPIPDVS